MDKQPRIPSKVIIERLEATLKVKDELLSTKEYLIKIQDEVMAIKDKQIENLEQKNKELLLFRNINFN